MTGSYTHRQHYYIFLSSDSFVRSFEYEALATALMNLRENYVNYKDIYFYQHFNLETIEYLLSYLHKNQSADSHSVYINHVEYECLKFAVRFITNDNLRLLWRKILADCTVEYKQHEVLSNVG
jgi:hypothetical protein